MNPLLCSSLAVSLLAAGNPIIEIQSDLSTADRQQSIRAYQSAGTVPDAFGPPVASDFKFGDAAGKKPVLWTFPADFDGDGSDELVSVRNRSLKKGTIEDLQLLIFEPPPVWNSNAKKVASTKKLTLGSAFDEGRIVLVGAIDSDGDGKDEAFVIREWFDGRQSVELRKLPKKKNKKMKKAFASDESFGMALTDWNLAACGADVDGDGDQELVCVRRGLTPPDQLFVFEPPTTLDGETGPAIRSDLDIEPLDGGLNLQMQRIDRTGNGTDELAFVRSYGGQAGLRLQICAAPASVAGELGPVEFTEPNLVVPSDAHDVVSVFGLRGYTAVPPKPPADLSGTWQADFEHFSNGAPETLPTMNNLNAVMAGGNTFSILLPTFNPTNGTYSQDDATIDFGGALHKFDVVSTGATYWLHLGVAGVAVIEDQLVVTGTYTGTKDPNFGPDETVTGGTFTWVRTGT